MVRKHFDTPAAYADYVQNTQSKRRYESHEFNIANGYNLLRNPATDTTLVNAAREQLSKLLIDIPTTRREFTSEVAGAFPNVPAFLSGDPECMWLPYATDDSTAPIKIYVHILCSAAISNEATLIKRGVALMALIIALSERRQVTVCSYAAMGTVLNPRTQSTQTGAIVSYDIPTTPLIIAQIVANLVKPDVTRAIALHAVNVTAYNDGHWVRGHDSHNNYNEEQVRADLNAAPDDIIIPGLHANSPLLADPIKWLNTEINRALNLKESN